MVKQSARNIAAAVVLSCLAAGGVTAVSAGSAALESGGQPISIDRADKGDRLIPAIKRNLNTRPSDTSGAVSHRPPGCEPAFSPIADPAHADFFKRCLT
jgi:hypothetical protein